MILRSKGRILKSLQAKYNDFKSKHNINMITEIQLVMRIRFCVIATIKSTHTYNPPIERLGVLYRKITILKQLCVDQYYALYSRLLRLLRKLLRDTSVVVSIFQSYSNIMLTLYYLVEYYYQIQKISANFRQYIYYR